MDQTAVNAMRNDSMVNYMWKLVKLKLNMT